MNESLLTSAALDPSFVAPRQYSDRLFRRLTLQRLGGVQQGRLNLIDAASQQSFGQITPDCDLQVTLYVYDPNAYARLVLRGSMGVAEGYMAGEWDCDDLTALVRLFLINREIMMGLDTGLSRLAVPLFKAFHALHRNNRRGSRDNIATHYDLGNDFYRLFLDRELMYSSAIFPSPDSSLEAASFAKNERICQKLQLQPEDHLLEIGSGWGGFALHAAGRYGCRVTTTTISQAQYDLARERVQAAGLADRITVLKEDYRDLRGGYDKLVSIEMVEAVGWQYFDAYFGTCSRLLRPDGLFLLQGITVPDQEYERIRRSVDFIQRYIFPGGCLPSLAAIMSSVSRVTDLRLFHLEDFGSHYALTLRHWRERFQKNRERVRALGYSESFLRMWEHYLCYCEGGFLERTISVAHLLFTKPGSRREPLVPELE